MARASPSGERELPWQPARARLHESQKLAAAIGALLLGRQKRHQPADPLIATSGVNQLRSISRDENARWIMVVHGSLSEQCPPDPGRRVRVL